LINKHFLDENTIAFEIEKPDSFNFIAGQTIDISLTDNELSDPKGNKRIFSIASSPSEKNLLFATRLSGSVFKNKLNSIKINDQLEIAGPFGAFKLHPDVTIPAVFIAGGIGITPFRSMILAAQDHDFPHKIFLFFSNNDSEKIPFHYTFSNINHAHFQYIPTITDKAERWTGEVGRIDSDLIRKYFLNVNEPIYYLAGPNQMVNSMKKMILGFGVPPDHIKQSIFIGY
jgi:ferredoxin-NADP reductase